MLGGSIVIYEFEERYYHITEQVAFCIKIKEGLKEWNLTDVFEYSVFGSPNQKIGNFTGQKKLGEWS